MPFEDRAAQHHPRFVDNSEWCDVPNELAFYAQQEVPTSEGVFLGFFRAVPYERIRMRAYCPYDADGSTVLTLTHVEKVVRLVPWISSRWVLGSTVNQVPPSPAPSYVAFSGS